MKFPHPSMILYNKKLKQFVNGVEKYSYTIATKVVTKPIPLETGYGDEYDEDGFPLYLKEFKKYYEKSRSYYWNPWKLQKEYIDNRPTYTIKVSYKTYDVEFNDFGKKEIERRYNIHKRNMEKYAKLMENF